LVHLNTVVEFSSIQLAGVSIQSQLISQSPATIVLVFLLHQSNNCFANDYGIEKSKARGKKHISFLTTIAGFNVHLDAQLKFLKSKNLFDFRKIFNLMATA